MKYKTYINWIKYSDQKTFESRFRNWLKKGIVKPTGKEHSKFYDGYKFDTKEYIIQLEDDVKYKFDIVECPLIQGYSEDTTFPERLSLGVYQY